MNVGEENARAWRGGGDVPEGRINGIGGQIVGDAFPQEENRSCEIEA